MCGIRRRCHTVHRLCMHVIKPRQWHCPTDRPRCLGNICQPTASPTGGCALSTGQTIVRSGAVSACQGSCLGHLAGTSCKSLCISGWRVCTGSDICGASLKALVGSARSSLPGCYAFNLMHNCSACWSTRTGSVSSLDVARASMPILVYLHVQEGGAG